MSKKKQTDGKVSPEDERRENNTVLAAEHEGDKPANVPPVAEDKEPEPEIKTPDPEPKHFQDDARSAIYAKSKQVRSQQKAQDLEDMDDDGRVMAIKMDMESSGYSDDAITLRLVREGYMKLDDDEVAELEATAGAEIDDEPELARSAKPTLTDDDKPAGDENKAVDTSPRQYTITVRGEDSTVDSERVIEAGIATLQKERNADQMLQELNRYEQSLRDYETKLRENAARGLGPNGEPLVPTEDGKGLPDDTGAENLEAVKSKVAAVRAAVFEGDDERFEEALTDLVTSVGKGRGQHTPPLDSLVEQVAERFDRRNQQDQQRRTAQTVNETFKSDYADLYEDDQKFALTQTEFNRLRQARPEEDPVKLMREAGDSMRELFEPKADSIDDVLEQRRNDKRRTPSQSNAGHRRKPQKQANARPPTRTEVVAEMRRQRGL